jgi:hypothetical protein
MPPAGLRCTKCNLSFGFDGSSESEACVSFGDRFFHTSWYAMALSQYMPLS